MKEKVTSNCVNNGFGVKRLEVKEQWINPESIQETYTKAGIDIMSKEPKSHKGSERFWDKISAYAASDGCEGWYGFRIKEHKELYDKLVSLEAKIEELEPFKKFGGIDLASKYYELQSEYQQLLKEHNLS
jgi:hypothetical protein